MKANRVHLFAVAACMSLAASTSQAQHSDIEMEIDQGRVITEPRLVEGEFGEGLSPSFRLNEPGFEAEDGVLSSGDVVGIAVPTLSIGADSRSLWFWDGMGGVSFAASPHELRVTNPGSSLSTRIDGVDPSADIGLGVADDEGGLHQDLVWDLADASGTGVDPPNTGVYLWATHVTIPGRLDSDPVYWLGGVGVEEEVIDRAIDYVAVNFGLIPEPSTFLLLALGGIAVFGARHRTLH